jgi:hypothetical protein
MKNLIASIILISGVLFCMPVQSYATTTSLICSTPSGLIAVQGTTCSAAFTSKTTSTVPGLTEGLCAKVVSGELTYGSCGGGGTTSTLGVTGTYSAPFTVLGGYAGTGKTGFGFYTLGSSATDTCDGRIGEYLDLVVDVGGAYNGPDMTIDHFGQFGFCKSLNVAGSVMTTVSVSSPSLVTTGTYQDTSGGQEATMSLGQTGAPSGGCSSGSIYTRLDGTPGATLYVCQSSLWVAATSP